MNNPSIGKKIHYSLRLAIAMCFIGHGAFGIITKQVWCNYFAVFGIDSITAYKLMPIVGIFDISMGILIIVYPLKLVPVWLVIWGLFTSLLRPLAGEPFAEFIERAGNYGAPMALLLLYGSPYLKGWFSKLNPDVTADNITLKRVTVCLSITVFLLLLGHGWLNLLQMPGLINQYKSLGFTNPAEVSAITGVMEIIAAFAVLYRPNSKLLFVLLVWKMLSEMFYPNYPVFEWIERGGSYLSIFTLWLIAKSPFTWKNIFSLIKKTSY